MSRRVALARTGVFGKDIPRELSLSENALARKLNGDDADEYGPFAYVPVQRVTYSAAPWEVVAADPSAGSVGVILPDPSAPLAIGSWIAVKNDTDSTTAVTVQALRGTIDGAASFLMTTERQFQWFYSTGAEWKKGPGSLVEEVTIGPFTLSTDQTTYSPTGWSGARYVLLNPTVQTLYINSFDPNVSIRRKTLVNVATSDSDIRIRNNSFIDSTAANRVTLRKGNNVYLLAQDAVDIWYDEVTSTWRPV